MNKIYNNRKININKKTYWIKKEFWEEKNNYFNNKKKTLFLKKNKNYKIIIIKEKIFSMKIIII